MRRYTRRDFIKLSGAAVASFAVTDLARLGISPDEPYTTCFYQFEERVLRAMEGPAGLPSGPGFRHILSHSHPGQRPHPDTAKRIHALGSSFKYAPAFDAHKCLGWETATDEQLRTWAIQYREAALVAEQRADCFAFNEMPTTGASTPRLRDQVARFLRHLHSAGGGPRLRGVFYFTERNLEPENWKGDADAFWEALDETCDLVVGEHYHGYSFAFSMPVTKYADHLFALPRWLQDSGRHAQVSIARHKYTIMHSSYFGPKWTGWAGVDSTRHNEHALRAYYRHLVGATRYSEFGKRRIGFGPLAADALAPPAYEVLISVLAKDAGA